jgi:hypothetical protein
VFSVGESVPPERMRAGDRDREVVIDSLRTAFEEGRLDLAEFNERLTRAGMAATFGELDTLVNDLPERQAQADQKPEPRRAEPRRAERPVPARSDTAATVLRAGFMIVFLNFSVWLVLVLNEGFDAVHPWWLWLALGWGGLLTVQAVRKQRAERPGVEETRRRELGEGNG